MSANWKYGYTPSSSPETIGTGNGTLTTFTYTVTWFPVLPVSGGGTVIIKVNGTQVGTDDGNGNLTGTGGGYTLTSSTINYATGAISVTFTAPVTSGQAIIVNYNSSTINLTPANNDDVVFEWIQCGLAAGWTVPSSSDSSTYNSSGNQITARGTGAGAFGHGTGSWVRLKAPTGTREFLIQRGTTAGNWYIGRSNLGFTGTGNGAVSATVAPTATTTADQIGLFGSTGTGYTVTKADFFNGNAAGTYHTEIAFDANSPYGFYLFSFTKSPVAAAACFQALISDSLAAGSYMSADTDPYWAYANSVSSALTAPTAANCTGSTNGTLQNNIIPLPWPSNFGANPYTGKDDLFPHYYYGNGSASPISYKGQSYYYKANSFTATSRLTGTLLDVVTLNDTVMANVWCFPWNGLAILLG